ncbi:heparinase II/III family protein [Frigidibacter sp. ROC022]|uniref:heparinase II/III family protein n=1 Tax=Frigidibacter sp. ROC022 TaxID=2971796 RepID=UPI00215A7C35|nr:heparinase II/III family protein [Frigidibacter sp. ROC022]MCR8724886.1 heparinase II/III family protein [Frigidibacter sp. ROC022]
MSRLGVVETAGGPARRVRVMNRLHARLAGFARAATGFVSQPEPRTIGSFARGRQLLAGNYMFAGILVQAEPGTPLFSLPDPDPTFAAEAQGFAWLDDLAAVGDTAARKLAQRWLAEWLEICARGHGPGWTPDLTGRRLIRWINHALFLMMGADKPLQDGFYRSLAQQTLFLGRRWQAASPGLPRFEALTGLIVAGLSLDGMSRFVQPALRSLAAECERTIDLDGGIPTRNPEELLDIFTLLNWASAALSEAGMMAGPAHLAALERMAPSLRALRHSDGGLARFHGGGRGPDGRLDTALAASGVRSLPLPGLHMGYARATYGRTSLIMDAASPPKGAASRNGHASTLAIEVTSGRRPLLVNCGSGRSFGAAWRMAGRATASHSTLEIVGYSSSRFGPLRFGADRTRDYLVEVPEDVRVQQATGEDGTEIIAAHDGYVRTHGLTHMRRLEFAQDGRSLGGEDTLAAVNDAHRATFDRALDRVALQGIRFALRFHLHPEVDAELDMGGTAVSMVLRSGEVWVFRHDGVADLSLEPSVYLERGRLRPRATKQVVLSAAAIDYASRVRWSLAKAQEVPLAIRDLERDDTPWLD